MPENVTFLNVAEDACIYIVKLLKFINKKCELLSLSNLQYHLIQGLSCPHAFCL